MNIREQYIKTYSEDIRAYPECFKAYVVADPEGTAENLIDGLSDCEVKSMLRFLKSEIRILGRAA